MSIAYASVCFPLCTLQVERTVIGLDVVVQVLMIGLDVLVQVLMSRPREEWVHNIGSRYKALENFTQEDARLQFLRILRSLPYGMHTLCACQSIEQRTKCIALLCRHLSGLVCSELVCHIAGNSTFFFVRRIEDPIALLPNKLILGINKRCACMQTALTVNAAKAPVSKRALC